MKTQNCAQAKTLRVGKKILKKIHTQSELLTVHGAETEPRDHRTTFIQQDAN